MNPDLEKELESDISRALRGLPDLAAPPGLVTRTMLALEQPAPWRVPPWIKWPMAARIAFLLLALSAVTAVFVELRMLEPGLLAGASRRLSPLTSGVVCLWNVLGGLASAVALAVEHLGKVFMLACLVAAAGACAFCAGFGTVLVRLVLAKPANNKL